ncbi:MAG TPA: DNA replication and repair protein RecF [Candidatus Limnocylindrales bacterium]|nr:DNA replication and repair protein RecF [Candidatus Limnocylindrales bacterium]
MRLLSLELRDFRNHREARATLDQGSVLLLGPNGSGKTNWIEAAVLLSLGRSFRGARDRELVRNGAAAFEVRGVVEGRGGVTRELTARGSREGTREMRIDGEALARLTDLLGRFPTVHFSVDDVSVFGGGVPERRRFLDVALCQLEPAYVGSLRDYTSALKQRNRLLAQGSDGDRAVRSGRPRASDEELSVWETILARAGAELDRRREGLARDLHTVMRDLAARVDPALAPLLEYVCVGGGSVEERLARLSASRGRDLRLGWTGDGPHRARLICKVGGMELAEGASRGYSRLYSILLRLALARVLEERLDEAPVVLLDDPESELDARWIGALLALLPESSQLIVTACRALSNAPTRMTALPIESLAACTEVGAA